MEGLIRQINALIHRPASTPGAASGGDNKTQAFLHAFEQIVTNRRGYVALRKARCWATQHGWLLILDPVSLHAALWSPAAQVRVDLPRLAADLPRNCKCLLSHEEATSHGCVLLVVDMDAPSFRYCRVDGKNRRWYAHEYSFEALRRRPGPSSFQVIRSVAAAYGYFYFPVSPTELVCMELMCYEFSPEPRFTTVEHAEVCLPGLLTWEETPRHLVECGGELLMVVQFSPAYDGPYQQQNVYRMDFEKRRWTQAWQQLPGGRVLLLGPGPSHFAVSLPAGELGVEDSRVYIVTPEMPMYLHNMKTQFNWLYSWCPADPTLARMHALAANACGFVLG